MPNQLTAFSRCWSQPRPMPLQPSNPYKGHKSLRKGRASAAGQLYLITFTTNNRVPIFLDHQLATEMARALHNPKLWRDAELMAWVLMPDHWHGLIQLGDKSCLSALVRNIKSNTARYLPDSACRPVWGRGFHDRAMRREDDLRAIARYIVMNPVRAGLVTSVRFYAFWDAVWL
ncbi:MULTISPECIES: transposase [Stenotrophomonas]|uniref:REP-associated tyrosine transposase n=1 Tax=Stenotrophomonas TaxID=40323 RepID=UPI001E58EB8B|nr:MULTISPECIES: transposase [Stenotrophomonas]